MEAPPIGWDDLSASAQQVFRWAAAFAEFAPQSGSAQSQSSATTDVLVDDMGVLFGFTRAYPRVSYPEQLVEAAAGNAAAILDLADARTGGAYSVMSGPPSISDMPVLAPSVVAILAEAKSLASGGTIRNPHLFAGLLRTPGTDARTLLEQLASVPLTPIVESIGEFIDRGEWSGFPSFARGKLRPAPGGPATPRVHERLRPALEMLADRPVENEEQDLLSFAPYADALANLIDHPRTDTPLVIAVSAEWGSGKTSLAKLVERRLNTWPIERGEPSHITCWFNAWMHNDAEHLGPALAAEVARVANGRRLWWRRLLQPLPGSMLTIQQRRRRRGFVAATAFGLAAVGALLAHRFGVQAKDSELSTEAAKVFGPWVASITVIALIGSGIWSHVFAAAKGVASFLEDPQAEAAQGSMRQVSDQLGTLLAQATRGKRRIVIFIDDLERCSGERAIEVCQTANQLLSQRDVVTVLIADMGFLAAAAEANYSTEHARAGSTNWGLAYLQKIVQIQFDLPSPRPDELRRMLKSAASRPDDLKANEEQNPRPSTMSIVLGGATFGIVIFAYIRFSGGSQTAFTTAGGALAGAFFTLFNSFQAGVKSRKNRAATEAVDRKIDEQQQAGETDPEALRQAVLASPDLSEKQTSLIDQRVQRKVTDDSIIEAESVIMGALPLLPRTAKRMLNRLRVLVAVAIGREMFGGTPEIEARHLGKWVALSERWPEVGAAVLREPDLMGELESAGSVAALRNALKGRELLVPASQELVTFLNQPIRLIDRVERLAHFEPAALSLMEQNPTA